MELLYIWLGEAKDKTKSLVFENQSFKFTSEFDISFDNENKELTISENKYYDSDFYKVKKGYEAPFKVTCIVGENGAGKTCLIEMLISLCNKYIKYPSFDLFDYEQNLIVWKTNNDINYFSYKLDIQNNRIVKRKYDELKKDLPTINIIYYSNYLSDFDKKYDNFMRNFYDISTDNLIDYELDNAIENYQFRSIDRLTLYRFIELKRKIIFYFKNQDFLDEINSFKRDFFIIAPGKCDFNLLLERYKEYGNLYEFIIATNKLIDKKISSNIKNKERLFWFFARELWFQCLHLIEIDIESGVFSEEFNLNLVNNYDSLLENLNPENCVCNLLHFIIKIFNNNGRETITLSTFSFMNYPDISIRYFNLLSKLYDISDEKDNNTTEIRIKMDSQNFDLKFNLISEFLDIYTSLKKSYSKSALGGEFVNFSFEPRFSLGEKGLLTLFSRLYDLIKNRIEIKKESDYIFIFDEGEIGFHPQWCKKYVEILVSYLQELFAEHNIHIHLIITTNNPIVLSDILPDDVIYLKNKTSLKADERPKMAFGSNILDLYSDNFFIQDGLIGSFAQKKLSDLLEKINSDEFKPNSNDENLIKNIGDINIRNYISALYNGAKTKYFAKNGISND